MSSALWKTCTGSFVTAVFCVTTCAQSFGADTKSLEDMEKELNALKASVSALTDQIDSVKQDKAVVASSSSTKDDVEALKSEVTSLKEEMKTAAQAEQKLKASDIEGNVYSEFAKRVKLGGQIRTRAEYATGMYQVPTGNATLPGAGGGVATRHASTDDDYVLNQTRLWADADVNEHLRVFIQLQDARVFGAEGTTLGFANAYSENSIFDLHQGYFDLKNLFDLPLTVRVGRQEIIWGDHRVIGNFVWNNVGRSFDGGRVMWDTDDIHAEAFAAKVNESGFVSDSDQNVYASLVGFKKLVPGALLELMYIQKNDQNNTTNNATINGFSPSPSGAVEIHDVGARITGKVPNLEAIDYTAESHGQFGDYGNQTQRAWAFAGVVGYTFKDLAWTPRFGVEYDYASGDHNPNDNTHTTFDNLYPTNHWNMIYGSANMIGWQNMHDARANIKVMPTSKLTTQVDYHYFWLANRADGWYMASGALALPRPGVGGSFTPDSNSLADEIDLTVSYKLYKNVDILAGYSFFDPNAWITQATGQDYATQWGYIQTTVTF